MNYFAGLDVSVKETSICIVDDTGKIVREVKVASEPQALLAVLKNPAYQRGKAIAIAEWPTPNGPADYALFVGLTCVGLVEAKRKRKNVAAAIDQTGRYAQAFSTTEDIDLPTGSPWPFQSGPTKEKPFRVPFLFATNGRPYLKQVETQSGIWFRDARDPTNIRRALTDWPTPEGLKGQLEIDRQAAQERLKSMPVDFAFDLWPHHKRAIQTVENALSSDGKRSMLMAMATGTGKTKLAIDPNAVFVSVAEAIGHLPPIGAGDCHPKIWNHSTRGMSDLNSKRLSVAKPGASNAYMAETEFGDLSLTCHRKVNRRLQTRCFNDVYTRMRPDHPSPTITTKCHSISNGRFGHYDMKQVRGLSVREAAILQSFPEDYIFYPQDQVEPLARMIGNAVPPKLAQFYAGYLVNSITDPGHRV
jgi:site-specific DNA-cytosine methylase